MAMGDVGTGEITTSQPTVDFFFDGFAGETVEITMIALEEGLDPILRLYGPDNALIEENDDIDLGGGNRNSRITASLPSEGQYRIEAAAFSGTGPFEVTLNFPSILSDNDTLSEGTPEIRYDYEGTAGQEIIIDMRAAAEGVDPLLQLLDPSGAEIARDDDGGGFPNARIQITLPVDGTYTIVAGVFGSNYGPYEITLAEL